MIKTLSYPIIYPIYPKPLPKTTSYLYNCTLAYLSISQLFFPVYMSHLGVCLVVGGSGWTGSFLVSLLVRLQGSGSGLGISAVHSADVRDPAGEGEGDGEGRVGVGVGVFVDLHVGAEHHPCDITSMADVQRVIDRVNPTVVFHLASVIDLRAHPSPLLEQVNVGGTANIIAAMQPKPSPSPGRRRYLVYTSTLDVVSQTWGVTDADESTLYATSPSNDYKRTKIAAEKMVLRADSDLLRTTALRPGHIYGPGDPILKHVLESPVALGPKEAEMSFVYVQNCAFCHILAAVALIEENTAHSSTTPSTKVKSEPVRGHSFFVADFDLNFSDIYCKLGRKKELSLRVPWWVIIFIVIWAELVEHLCYYAFNTSLQHPVTGISRGILEACDNLTIKAGRARKTLQYGNKSFSSSAADGAVDMVGCIEFDECVSRTKLFADRGDILFK
jgi:nucleoside-diphosphate-sugar epimerase